MNIKLFHGTAEYALANFLISLPQKQRRRYLQRGRSSFCCSTSLQEASFFALRRTPSSDLSKTGIVLEFLGRNMIENKDFVFCRDESASLRDEQEASVFNVKKLQLVAIYRWGEDSWKREVL